MATATVDNATDHTTSLRAWLPLAVLLAAVLLFANRLPSWVFMWVLAGSIYAGGKWLTLADCRRARSAPRGLKTGYLLLWPGMGADAFFSTEPKSTRTMLGEWFVACAVTIFGVLLIVVAVPLLIYDSPLVAGWLGMTGLLLALHCGLFHLLSLAWRCAGVDAAPIMRAPILSASLGEFWGRRWNRAFRDLAHAYAFRPLVGRWGIAGATLATFFASGMVHDLVITVPARGGWGGPTLYFFLQGVGLIVERTPNARRWRLRHPWVGRAFAWTVVLGPVGLLFPVSFVERIVLPMLNTFHVN